MKFASHIELFGKEKTPAENDTCSDPFWTLSLKQHEYLLASKGKTFSFATRFFPATVRDAVITLYAFFRTLDDLVDERGEGWCRHDVEQELDTWHNWFVTGACELAPREPL